MGEYNYQLKGSFSVHWGIEDKWVKGEGVIFNISLKNLEIITDKAFKITDDCVFLITPAPGNVVLLPSHRAKIVWVKEKESDGVKCLHCGLEFLK